MLPSLRRSCEFVVVVLAACNRPTAPERLAPAPSARHYAVSIRQPADLTSVSAKSALQETQSLRVACETCHSVRGPTALPAEAGSLRDFHVGLTVQHGALPCASCHLPADGRRLRLASGEQVPMADALRLCAQCHGPQARDYGKGAHGGMQGYWDLSRGPRTRNHCIDCHDPHAPKYVGGMPAPGPRDRFLDAPKRGGGHG